ncbi:MAG: hypothetical protein ACK4S6_04270 [Roseateles asaccharophilus]|uniref:DUF3828 domain-containing protein n=1 Tax=Roseateles asaccharophilus TaxID=582607 RepID=A0A4R6NBE0_9BURK|nr:hypothetical protein [Roseateles asaccharophilus]MDN3542999.1 hypothetical protein [Roseateles asaccharophilus]TDP13302.1 hypothetical protein DFR39_101777 [Roseateles asaccharophilus]
MKLQVFRATAWVIAGLATHPCQAQELQPPRMQQLIVETLHTYQVSAYRTPVVFVAGEGGAPLSGRTPAAVLASYLNKLAAGDMDGALKSWTASSQRFIEKRNAKFATADLVAAAKAQHAGTRYEFSKQISYGDYVIIELQSSRLELSKTVATDAYALTREDGEWRLTQALADDPVMCCRAAPNSRIQRIGVPGGDFKQLLEALR